MNTTAAATEANVTVATIRGWARNGVIAAVKVAGRWIIDTASLAHRITIGKLKQSKKPVVLADLTTEYYDVVADTAFHAASCGSKAGLKQLLDWVKARNITAVMGDIDPRRVQLTATQWADLERLVRLQAGCVTAER